MATITALAFLLSEFKGDIDLRRLLTLLVVAGFPMALIMLQPDLGQVLTLIAISLALLVVGSVPGRFLAPIALVGVIGVVGVLNSPVLAQYQRDRLTAFLDPANTAKEATYNVEQSTQAVANGGFTGQGLFQGQQTKLGFVPEQQTDFIFTAVAEQFGVRGVGFWSCCSTGCSAIASGASVQIARDPFGTYLCVGVLAMFAFSVFQNVGMAMGIMPVTGIPLLLLSSGGSSTITAFAGIGLVLNVHMRRFR